MEVAISCTGHVSFQPVEQLSELLVFSLTEVALVLLCAKIKRQFQLMLWLKVTDNSVSLLHLLESKADYVFV